MHLEVKERDEVQAEAESVEEEHPSSPTVMMASAPESPTMRWLTH